VEDLKFYISYFAVVIGILAFINLIMFYKLGEHPFFLNLIPYSRRIKGLREQYVQDPGLKKISFMVINILVAGLLIVVPFVAE